MKMSGRIFAWFGVLLFCAGAMAAGDAAEPLLLSGGEWRAAVGDDGVLRTLETSIGRKHRPIDFRTDGFSGPAWFVQGVRVPLTLADRAAARFEGSTGETAVWLRYADRNGKLSIVAGIRNGGKEPLGPIQAGLCLGLDCVMGEAADPDRRFFPTLLRCEKTHFWGYAMTPGGRILGISSPDPVASWHLSRDEDARRIRTVFVDLLNPGPLPARHPAGLDSLAPGESREWTLVLEEIDGLPQVKPRLAVTTGAPMIDLPRYTLDGGAAAAVTVNSTSPVTYGSFMTPKGKKRDPQIALRSPGVYAGTYHPMAGEAPDFGVHTLQVANSAGKTAEARLYVRRPWAFYMEKAWEEAIAKPQKASPRAESWYGLYTAFLAPRYFMNLGLEAESRAAFSDIVRLLYDPWRGVPCVTDERLLNHAAMAGLQVCRYGVTQDQADLMCASRITDFLCTRQAADGAFHNGGPAFYISKSILEVMTEERKAGRDFSFWKERYDRHYDSVRRAMDELASRLGGPGAGGLAARGDGTCASGCAQLAMFALLQRNPAARAKYLVAARNLAAFHRCFSPLAVPDCRMNGVGVRFGDAPHDIKASPDMLTGPHGWSAWHIYGLWYLYQLTGEADYLRQAMNALGSCVQLLDADTGELRWAFVPEPQLRVKLWKEDPEHPGTGKPSPAVVGEQYLPMISGWYKAPAKTRVSDGSADNDGGSGDNDVHEIFKCVEEVALTAAYVVEYPGGRIESWNATVTLDVKGDLVVAPTDRFISRVHLNLQMPRRVRVRFVTGFPINKIYSAGMRWVGPGGVPENLRAWGEDPATGLDAIIKGLGGD